MPGKRILIVEDEALIAMELEERLKRLGYSDVSSVFTGEDAVQKAQESQPHLIFMDIVLSGEMDGLEASRVICSRLNIPVIYITGSSERILQKSLQEANLTHRYSYIIKPFDEKQLRKKIDTLLGEGGSGSG
ncbi:MAG: response regulator [Candidatus Aminicenantes bacterium]|nr:MAG: response regulator [Candidatus Aminicenantes bacterium]